MSREPSARRLGRILPVALLSLVACGGGEMPAEDDAPSEPDLVRLSEAQVRSAGIRTAVVEAGEEPG